jgi:hypothetical protein|tara:strand:- start:644 stop:883 length:240 start_codon:yes stop_codon:yes gene_type:complete
MVDLNEEMIEEIYAILKDGCSQTDKLSVDNRVKLYRLHFIKIYVDKMIYGTSNDEVENMFAEWNIPRLIHEEKPDGWEE